jgi:hypothetical protein
LKGRYTKVALALTAILLGAIVYFSTPNWIFQKRAALDSPLVQRVLASPIHIDLNGLLTSITILNSVQITDMEGNYHNDIIYLERHLERLWLSEIAGLQKPDIPTIAEAIDYEKENEKSSPHSLHDLRRQAYMAALIPGAPEPTDKPPQEILNYPEHYTSLGQHRWSPTSASNLTQVALALTNRLNREIYLPPIISVFVTATRGDEEFVCANGAKAPWQGGGGMPPEWRLLLPNQRILVLCNPVNWDASAEEALQGMGKQNYWSLRVALYPPTQTELLYANPNSTAQSNYSDSLLLSEVLSTPKITEMAGRILDDSSCIDRRSCLSEYSSVILYHGEIWMFGFISGALTFLLTCSLKKLSRFKMALALSAAIFILCFIAISTIDYGGILAEIAIFIYTAQALGATLGVWLIFFLFYRQGHSQVRL